MKSEHRHELQTNELGKFTEKLTGFMEVHGNRLMIGVCVAALVASAIIYWVRTQKNSQAAAWRELASAVATNKPEEFFDVWNAHPGTPTGLWARVHEGETRLGIGVQALFRNLDTGLEDVKKARVAFEAVVEDRRSPPEVRERALLGLGRALESLSEPAEAVTAYEMLVKEFKDSLYKKDAEERISILNKESGQEFYAWFSKYERPKATEKLPHDKIGDDLSEEENALWDKLNKADPGKPAGDDAESPTIPEAEKPDEQPDGVAPSKKEEKPDSPDEDDAPPESKAKPESKSDSDPDSDSKADDEKKPAADSKSDES